MRMTLIVLGLVTLAPLGCMSDPCMEGSEPVLLVGQGVGGAFEEYTEGEEVELSIAPQGGFGVSVVLQTTGITASDETRVDVKLSTERMGEVTGDFTLEDAPLLCRSDGEGGSVSGLVVGFDPDVFRSNDDLLALDGSAVDLVVTIIEESRSTEARKPVTIQVGQ